MSIRIYLGTQAAQTLAAQVLAYSIRKHTSHPVQIIPLYKAIAAANISIPIPTSPALKPQTPFTFQRFAIPALCQYQGKAIYLDSDMLVFRDISQLWQQPFTQAQQPTADLLFVPEPLESGRSLQYSVMLLNCAQLQWDASQLVQSLMRGTWTYQEFVLDMSPATVKRADLPLGWNDLERYDPARTALLHYTDMPHHPWLCVSNPLAPLWCNELLHAVADGAIARATVQESIHRGWVRPSLLTQIDTGIADPQRLSARVRKRDRYTFTPPHIWQKYLRHAALQQQRPRKWFSCAYATLKAIVKPDHIEPSNNVPLDTQTTLTGAGTDDV
ncbi:MAG: glycosyltransferase [Cyanobacteria bacterium P01_D01_bin.105]